MSATMFPWSFAAKCHIYCGAIIELWYRAAIVVAEFRKGDNHVV